MSVVYAVARLAASRRVSRFALVGATCALFQLAVNRFFLDIGEPKIAAFTLSFIVSAQLNFMASNLFTWRNRRLIQGTRWRYAKRWVGFNISSLAALAVSSTTFALTIHLMDDAAAVLCGIAAGALLTFFVGDRLVFLAPAEADVQRLANETIETPVGNRLEYALAGAPSRDAPGPAGDSWALRGISEDRLSNMLGAGVAIFLPCYNESQNLPIVLQRIMSTFEDIGVPYQVIIVDDGSQDATGAVALELAEAHPRRVVLVSHERNLGYGNALRSGFAAGLAGRWDWVGFVDSDNQFDPDEFKDLIAAAYFENADLVAGYRIKRADGPGRLLIGRLWHLLTRCVVGIRERDVDCGFKLVHRKVLERIQLHGTYAAVSPELLVKSRRAGFESAEVGVAHYPRTSGEQTGADVKVMIRSLISLFVLRWSLSRRRNGPSGSASGLGIGLVAVLLSICSFLLFYFRGQTLAYDDSISHLLIARRLLDGTTPGVAQLGSVWLPLPHILVVPFVWSSALLYSGIAGSLVSMIAFVFAAVFLFKAAAAMTGTVLGGWLGGLIFVFNPNMLYLQSTPMTETLLFACMAAGVYQLILWSQNERWQNLAGAAAAVLLASLTRYEGWVLLGSFAMVVLFISVRRSYRPDRLLAGMIFFLVLAAAGVAAWLLWNRVIFGSFTDFENGQFAKPSLWVGKSDVAVGNLAVAARTYLLAITGTAGIPMLALGIAGLLLYLWRGRLRPESVAPLTLLVFAPFFVVAIYSGQRPLHVREITGDLYNIRFGLVMLLPVTLFAAYVIVAAGRWLAAFAARRRGDRAIRVGRPVVGSAVACGVALLVVIGTVMSGGVLTLDEPLHWARGRSELVPAAAALRKDYDGGLILMEGFGNEYVTFASHVPADETIYEGSFRLWAPALANPVGQHIKWIYLSRTSSDLVWSALGKSPELADYRIRFDDGTRVIYERH